VEARGLEAWRIAMRRCPAGLGRQMPGSGQQCRNGRAEVLLEPGAG